MLNKTIGLILGAAIVLVSMPGCSVFRSSTQKIHVTAAPADATIMINGQIYKTPVSIRVPRNEALTVQAMKPGYYTYTRNVDYSLNTTGVLDTIGIFLMLFPGLGLFSSGSRSLNQTIFDIQLQEAK